MGLLESPLRASREAFTSLMKEKISWRCPVTFPALHTERPLGLWQPLHNHEVAKAKASMQGKHAEDVGAERAWALTPSVNTCHLHAP